LLLPIGATAYFFEAVFFAFAAAPPVAGALLGLLPPALAGAESLAAFAGAGALADSALALLELVPAEFWRRVLER